MDLDVRCSKKAVTLNHSLIWRLICCIFHLCTWSKNKSPWNDQMNRYHNDDHQSTWSIIYIRYRYVTKRVAMISAEFIYFAANIVMKWFAVASTVLTPVYIILGRSIMASNLIHTKCIQLSAHHHRSWINCNPNTRVAVVQSQIKNKSALYKSEYCFKILMCLAMCSNWNIQRELGMAVDAPVTPISFKIFNKIRFG